MRRAGLILVVAAVGHAGGAGAQGMEAPGAGVLAMAAKGVQIYVCAAAGGGAGFGWVLKAPEAMLATADGRVTAHHFAGPTWQAQDGSAVVGEALASGVAREGAAGVPWLVLRAKSHSGVGAFDSVTYVVRSETVGGLAPAGGCDGGQLGVKAQSAYSATYTLFGVR